MLRSSTPALDDDPEGDADGNGYRQHEDAKEGIRDPVDVELDTVGERARRRQLLRDSAEVGERLVGDDDGDGDRDQRLAQLLTLVPAEEELLHH
jgi:hypothetical protein